MREKIIGQNLFDYLKLMLKIELCDMISAF